ncbi:type VI secretion system baseplate subunit TssK [Xenorhabdus bovienii]|uniref:Type VI secretion protein n=6 Tax=Xenorhabdus bovienii TaxID=40576 RepID=A0A077PID7_XENBV|nr:type VI secretion system baseplate subunit TssK [Xenorhabdus bovienii]MCG3460494.1 type VI secretion system baseplate subunit TssK [Xenorhabdus bovienii]MCG3469491.1 type VI secretion system baseplate subunit TssK [Xenorhabdus bovienii]MCP9266534.1 type VI secretion system baseplate subunit TssK [Xenorhabdus bovienii subsp. africana]MDE1475196.1 type VI secretion system baseplate subunit TssK [Xenorhabdus bovienii]MDE1478253.1 type VI secretion system baseplate subunit TssK [Xenorhabdus bov
MPGKNRVIWHEGLFIKPQHFQQQQKHNDYLAHSLVSVLAAYGHGFSSLSINQDLLNLGRIGITEASGIMQDGTIFSAPSQDLLPKPLDIESVNDLKSKDIYLALPMSSDTIREIADKEAEIQSAVRYRELPSDVRDLHTKGGDSFALNLAQLTPVLMQGSEDMSAYTAIPLCRIKEKQKDGTIVLDSEFIPTCLSIFVADKLRRFMVEIDGLLTERSRTLAKRIGSPGQQGVADVAEFMMLQLLNRVQPLFNHYAKQTVLHPLHLYTQLLQTCGELRTFTDASRLPGNVLAYDHNNLTDTFQDAMHAIRDALNVVLTPRATSIVLKQNEGGIRVATLHDNDLLRKAEFVLAISASTPQEQLRRQFVQQTKVTSMEKIRDLVSVQLPGVPLIALSAAPRQLPYHSGYTYFRLDQKSPAWKEIQQGNSIAFHVSGDFPDLDMQLWAIRGGKE